MWLFTEHVKVTAAFNKQRTSVHLCPLEITKSEEISWCPLVLKGGKFIYEIDAHKVFAWITSATRMLFH